MNATDMSREWYALFNVKGLGPKRIHAIYRTLQDTDRALGDLFQLDWSGFQQVFPKLGRSIFDAIQSLDIERVEQDYQRLLDEDVRVVHLGSETYPRLVWERMQDSAPPVLFCSGYLRLLDGGVAIVGSRSASPKALDFAAKLAKDMALQGQNVISGYAKGVDTNAHLGALQADGTTTIVLSSGILDFSRKKTFNDVRWQGNILTVSQFHPSEKWIARNAMIRNSLVCALANAVVIVEAGDEVDENGRMSGTFDAGKTALRMGVPLFVVEPDALDSEAQGNRKLIKIGGTGVSLGKAVSVILSRLSERVAPAQPHTVPSSIQMSLF